MHKEDLKNKVKERLLSTQGALQPELFEYIDLYFQSSNCFPYLCIDTFSFQGFRKQLATHEVLCLDTDNMTFDELTAYVYAVNEFLKTKEDEEAPMEPAVCHHYYDFLFRNGIMDQETYDDFFAEAKEMILEKHFDSHEINYKDVPFARSLFTNCKEFSEIGQQNRLHNSPDVSWCLMQLQNYINLFGDYSEEEICELLSRITDESLCDMEIVFSERAFCEFTLNLEAACEGPADCQAGGIFLGIREGNRFYLLEHIEFGRNDPLRMINHEPFFYDRNYIRQRIEILKTLYADVILEIVGIYVSRVYNSEQLMYMDQREWTYDPRDEQMIKRDLDIIDTILADEIYKDLSKPYFLKAVAVLDQCDDQTFYEFDLADLCSKKIIMKNIDFSIDKQLPSYLTKLRSYDVY